MDLVVLVPDADWEQVMSALLESRPHSLGIRDITFSTIRHPYRDPGIRTNPGPLLQPMVDRADYAMVCVDHEGSGHQGTPAQLAEEIRTDLRPVWDDHVAAVVAAPELEIWVWADSPHVARNLGWDGPLSDLRTTLETEGLWGSADPKPQRPKEAMELAMRLSRKRRSPAVYGQLARAVGLRGCVDPAFVEMRATLSTWFPHAVHR